MVGILLMIAGLFVLALLFPGFFMNKEEDPFDRGEEKDDE